MLTSARSMTSSGYALITFPVLRHQNAPQVGMAFKAYPEEVIDLALVSIGGRPNGHDRIERWRIARNTDLQTQPLPAFEREQVIDHFEPWLGRIAVHRRQIGEKFKGNARGVAEELAEPEQAPGPDEKR